MARKVCTRILENWLKKGYYLPSDTCENHEDYDGDTSACSHFDHCERPADIWVYESLGEDSGCLIYGYCSACYDWCFPYDGWYRIVKVGENFKGVLK